MDIDRFRKTAASVPLTGTVTTSRYALGAHQGAVRTYIDMGAKLWIEFGDSSVNAVVGTSVATSGIEVHGILPEHTHIAVISESGTVTGSATPGKGN